MNGTSIIHSDSGASWAEQASGDKRAYSFDYAGDLGDAGSLASSIWTAAAPLVVSGQTIGDTATSAFITGGTPGAWHLVANQVTATDGGVHSRSFRLLVGDAAGFGVGARSVFPDLVGAIMSLRRDRLISAAGTYMPDVVLTDAFLLEQILAAEAMIQHDLRVYLTPREMVPFGATAQERADLESAGNVVVEEAGYDYTPDFYRGNNWGLLELRQRPIIEVHSLRFAYPSPAASLYEFPLAWMRLDKKYGRVNIVPTFAGTGLPLNTFMLSVLGGGRTIPLMLQCRYRAGLENAARDYPDILWLIKQKAVQQIIETQFVPASASTSVDGLSQSLSWDPDKHAEAMEEKIDHLRQSLHGVRMMVV